MATYYLDQEGGNDANDGLSFANRKKTPSGFTTLAAGDTVRVIASRESDLGSATWTDNTQTVVLPAAVNATVDACESGWVASTNVTASYTTGGFSYVEGSNCLNLLVVSAFTTGKLAYKAFGSPLDLSSYTMLSFIISSSLAGSMAANALTLNLCSDATGDTAIVSFPINEIIGQFRLGILLDNGAALPSAINSISITANVDPGTSQNIRIDNIVACKALDSGQHLSHLCGIKKNDAVNKEVYAVRAIDGVNIYLGNSSSNPTTPGRTWRGTSETINTKAIVPSYNSATNAVTLNLFGNFSGTVASPITISGGWNRTDMSTQTGETWHSRNLNSSGYAYGLYAASLAGVSYWTFEKFGFHGYGVAPIQSTNAYSTNIVLNLVGLTNCGEIFHQNVSGGSGYGPVTEVTITFDAVTMQLGTIITPQLQQTGRIRTSKVKVTGRKVTMCSLTSLPAVGGDAGSLVPPLLDFYDMIDVQIDTIHNCQVGFGGTNMVFSLRNCAFSLNTTNISANALSTSGIVWMENCTPTLSISSPGLWATFVNLTRNGVAGADSYNTTFGSLSKQSTVHSTSPFSWQVNTGSSSGYPTNTNSFQVAQIACKAGETTTISAWVRYNGGSTGRKYGLRARAVLPAGVTEQVSSGPDVGNTWNQISVTVTPTKDCVVIIDGWVASGTFYIDDMEVSVA